MKKIQKKRVNTLALKQPDFSKLLGLKLTLVDYKKVEATLDVKEKFVNRNGVMHGGAIMAFADDLGGTATFVTLEPGQSTTTIESKTNFLRPITIGDKIRAVCKVLNRGKTIVLVQTTIYRSDKKVAAIVTQTQMILTFSHSKPE
ncbi:MAG: PaaI family thioesterase [Pseudomonadota bacterium]|nr:PaaI family thioesterase [Pseudomonadota bacterium]